MNGHAEETCREYTASLVNDFSERGCVVSLEADVRACKVCELTNSHHALEPISGRVRWGKLTQCYVSEKRRKRITTGSTNGYIVALMLGRKRRISRSIPFPPQHRRRHANPTHSLRASSRTACVVSSHFGAFRRSPRRRLCPYGGSSWRATRVDLPYR